MTQPKKTAARGYGASHQKLRAELKKIVERGEAYCWRCGEWIPPGTAFDLGHDDNDRSIYRGPEHVGCNRATSGRKKRKALPRRWVLRSRSRACEICGTGYTANHAQQRTCSRACGRELRRRNAPVTVRLKPPPTGNQLSFTVCDVCGQFTVSKTCSYDCYRTRARNKYRAQAGIPLTAPLSANGRPRTREAW